MAVTPSAAGGTANVVVDPTDRRQTWWGTGAALTDASRRLLTGRPHLQDLLWSPDSAGGARLSMLRLPLSATDFSPTPWSWSWSRSAGAVPPPEQRRAVSMVRDQVLPRVPHLRVVGADWSAPASMKTSGTLRGGGLARTSAYGDLLVSQVRWLRRHGVPLTAATLGNEPGFSTDYPSMTMTDGQLATLGDSVGPRLRALGTALWALDHNWADRPRLDTVLGQSSGFGAAAFHCYAGDPSAMAGLPVPRMVTECSGTTGGAASTFAWDARHLVADAISAGSSGLMMWNLALDGRHGPLDRASRWGCKDCRGLLRVTPDGVVREPEFFVLAQLARAADPGARVLGVRAPSGVAAAAFANPDGSIGVFGHNGTGHDGTVRISVGDGRVAAYDVRAGELFSYRSP